MTEGSSSTQLSGSILEWAPRPIRREDLTSHPNISFVRRVGSTSWEEFRYESLTPLRDRDEEHDPPFIYVFYCRRSGKRLALLGPTSDVSSAIEADLIRQTFVLQMQRVTIAVDSLVKAIVRKPTDYSISYAYARAPAYGSALRNVIFYGEDLGSAGLFCNSLDLLRFASCGLRRASGGPQLLKISANGKLSFAMRSDATLLEIERTLGFLRDRGYLKTSLLDDEDQDERLNAR